MATTNHEIATTRAETATTHTETTTTRAEIITVCPKTITARVFLSYSTVGGTIDPKQNAHCGGDSPHGATRSGRLASHGDAIRLVLAEWFPRATISIVKEISDSSRACAAAVLEAVPHLMRVIREQVRSKSSPELSVPQFRALAFIGRNDDAMLSDVAAFLAQPLPSMSKLVDGLVAAGLVAREFGHTDRRRMALSLTTSGRRKYNAVVKSAEAYLAGPISKLPVAQSAEIMRAMETLNSIFHDPPETVAQGRSS